MSTICRHGINLLNEQCALCEHERLQGEFTTTEERVGALEVQVRELKLGLAEVHKDIGKLAKYLDDRAEAQRGPAARYLVKEKYPHAWCRGTVADRIYRVWSDGGGAAISAKVLGEGPTEDEAWLAACQAVKP